MGPDLLGDLEQVPRPIADAPFVPHRSGLVELRPLKVSDVPEFLGPIVSGKMALVIRSWNPGHPKR